MAEGPEGETEGAEELASSAPHHTAGGAFFVAGLAASAAPLCRRPLLQGQRAHWHKERRAEIARGGGRPIRAVWAGRVAVVLAVQAGEGAGRQLRRLVSAMWDDGRKALAAAAVSSTLSGRDAAVPLVGEFV
eukprot:366453-Chlamydomonas_euryale.AAC.5